jgi:hypothetical protein
VASVSLVGVETLAGFIGSSEWMSVESGGVSSVDLADQTAPSVDSSAGRPRPFPRSARSARVLAMVPFSRFLERGQLTSMSEPVRDYRLVYLFSERSLCFQRLIAAVPDIASADDRCGLYSRPALGVLALPDRVDVHLVRRYAAGDLEVHQDAGRIAAAEVCLVGQLADLIGAAEVDRLAWLYAHPEGWGRGNRDGWLRAAFELFRPMHALAPEESDPYTADFYELGQSFTGDGRPPWLTLRLGRRHDEIVLDHYDFRPDCQRSIELLERLDPPATPGALAVIEEYFGPHLAELAAWFDARGMWRMTDEPPTRRYAPRTSQSS